MVRIFSTLALLNGIVLLGSFAAGVVYFFELRAGAPLPTADQPLGWNWHMVHFVVGLFAAIFTLLVHCLIFTYFLGTGRWVKEVARAYAIPDQGLPRQTRELKRQAFPPALFAMLAIIGTAAAGAGAQTRSWPWVWHFLAALVTLIINAWAYLVEYRSLTANAVVMEGVMQEVNRKQEASAGASA